VVDEMTVNEDGKPSDNASDRANFWTEGNES